LGQLRPQTVLSGVNLTGKRILVTGVSAGLGVERRAPWCARPAGCSAARDLDKPTLQPSSAKGRSSQRGSFELVELDLANRKRACLRRRVAGEGRNLSRNHRQLPECGEPFGHTADGSNASSGRILGHFVLVNRIASLIRDGGRLINLSSAGHRYSNVDPTIPTLSGRPMSFRAYGRSKRRISSFAVAFDKRHRDRGVRAAAVHPGGIKTELGRYVEPGRMEK